MTHRHRNLTTAVLAASFLATPVQSAYAGVVSTQQYLATLDREAAIARIDAVLARAEVRTKLEQYGVESAAADRRIAALTDRELELLATELESLPAGGDLLAVAGITFIVLLILELVGVIDIFSKI